MRLLLQLLSFLGLALTIVPAVLVFMRQLPFQTHITLMFIGMVLWFGATPFWINRKESRSKTSNG